MPFLVPLNVLTLHAVARVSIFSMYVALSSCWNKT